MSIWIYRQGLRRAIVGAFLAFGLAGCSGESDMFAFLDPGPQKAEDSETRPDVSLAQADMARGGVTLVPPSGYCIDKRGLKQNFAVIAHCTSLGGKSGPDFVPLGLILVSVAPAKGGVNLAATLDAIEDPDAQRLEVQDNPSLALRQFRGATPEGTNSEYWRGLTQAGAHILSMTAYAPEGGSLSGPSGARILAELTWRTQAATPSVGIAEDSGAGDGQGATEPGKGLRGLLSGLFD